MSYLIHESDEQDRLGSIGDYGDPRGDDYNPVKLDCGHWGSEDDGLWTGAKLVCPSCYERYEQETKGRVLVWPEYPEDEMERSRR